MQKWIATDIADEQYAKIVTILHYTVPVSECIESIDIPKDKMVLVDTIVCSGMSEYRWIKLRPCKNKDNFEYIIPKQSLQKISNDILKQNRNQLIYNSILPASQVNDILNN